MVLPAVALLSAAALAYEILLLRLFAIISWHHFAALVVSLALLGYGASGTFLVFGRDLLAPRFTASFAACAGGFGIAAVAAFALAQRVPFNPLEVIWDWRQQLYLAQIYLLLAIPFLLAATAIGLALSTNAGRAGAVYAADLAGAGVGAVAALGALLLLPTEDCLRLIGALGFASAVVALCKQARLWIAAGCAILGIITSLAWPAAWLEPRPSPYKGLSLALNAPGAQVVDEASGPLGWLAVVASPAVPFRHAPGLSLTATVEPPEQLGIFVDAEALTPITRFDGDPTKLAYLDQQTAALPFHLRRRPATLVLGAGGGGEVLRALYHGASRIDAVDANPQLLRLVRRGHASFSGNLYDRGDVAVHVADARSFVAGSSDRWDIIQVALLDSYTAAASGVHATSEGSVYTIEALRTYLRHLRPGGLLAVTRWLQVPPRDSVKLLATAVAALAAEGADVPGDHLALIHGASTATLLMKNGAFRTDEMDAIRRFASARAFDVAWLPGIEPREARQFNRLPAPDLYDAAAALVGPAADRFVADYKFHVEPATDDRPFFFRFFRWGLLPELAGSKGRGILTLLDIGYLVILAALVLAAIASVALILLPLLALPRRATSDAAPRLRVIAYFFGLGLAFIFVEIGFFHRFSTFLGQPIVAVAVVLSSFLVCAGLGSQASIRLAEGAPRSALLRSIVPLIGVAIAYLFLLPELFEALAGAALWARLALAVGLVAPLAFCMGMPFPLGLRALGTVAPALVPWAWGVNGCASVLGAVLASLLAIHLGFTAVLALAVALYAVAAVVFPVRRLGPVVGEQPSGR